MTRPAPPVDRSAPPSPAPVRPFRLPPVSSAALANGLRLRSLRRAEVGLASLVLVVDAGEIRSPAGSDGLAVLTGRALPGGTRRRTGATRRMLSTSWRRRCRVMAFQTLPAPAASMWHALLICGRNS